MRSCWGLRSAPSLYALPLSSEKGTFRAGGTSTHGWACTKGASLEQELQERLLMVPPPVASLPSLRQAGDAACHGGEDQKCRALLRQRLSREQLWL